MNENWTKFIELYLQGELSLEDTAKLKAELDRNSEMRHSLELQKRIHETAKRSGQRQLVKSVQKSYQLQRTLKTSIVSVVVATVIVALGYLAYQAFENKTKDKIESSEALVDGKYKELDKMAELDNLPISYFEHDGNTATFLSRKGILISVPEQTFLLDGKSYDGKAIIQFQEALDASDIIKAGLSTTSGDQLLETQGMFQLKAFTPDGKQLTVNDKDGIYLQVPVEENKEGMMLFNGVKTADGQIDWQNPKPIEKLPIRANMLDLDLYPPGYEAKLDELKWSQKKQKRDSLYLSFEDGKSPLNQKFQNSVVGKSTEEKQFEFRSKNFSIYSSQYRNYLKAMSKPVTDISVLFYRGGFRTNEPNVDIKQIDRFNYDFTIGYVIPQQSEAISVLNDSLTAHPTISIKEKNISKRSEIDYLGLTTIHNDVEVTFQYSENLISNGVSLYEITYRIHLFKAIVEPQIIEAKRIDPKIFGKNKNISFTIKSLFEDAMDISNTNFLPPSKVLAIWKKDFNKTILATRDFEKRMKAIHETCNEKVFDVYANQLNKAFWQLDEQVVKMGYANFQAFADERVGALKLDNVHMNSIRQFYESNVSRLKELAKKDKNFQKAIEMAWDSKVRRERNEEVIRSAARVQKVFQDEYNLNLDNVYKQLGKSRTVGVTIYGGGPVYNIDKYVRDATIARKSATITDTETGKTAKITYNPITATVKNAKDYGKLYMYLMPEELSSFQRIDPINGKFDYSLNAAINYKVVFVGINEKGYFISDENSSLIELKSVSEKEFERTLEKISKDRQKSSTKSSDMSRELNWLKLEKQDYKEQKLRQQNAEFRRMMKGIVHPCASEQNPFQ